MTATLFGFLDSAQDALSEFVTGLLMIAGGFFVGYLLGGTIGWAIGRWALKQEKPQSLVRLGRPVGGVILALIVAIIVFTGKGKPLGDGGDGKGTPNDTGKGQPKIDDTVPPKNVKPPIIDKTPATAIVQVTILGGEDVTNERFYLIDEDRTPKTFAELKEAITSRKGKEKGKVVVAIVFPAKNALPREHPAVTQVAKWANEDAKLDVSFPASR